MANSSAVTISQTDTISYTVTDTHGDTASGALTVEVLMPYTSYKSMNSGSAGFNSLALDSSGHVWA